MHVPGLYEKIRAKELKLAFSPDPRLWLVKDDPVEYERVAATAPKYSPTVLYQVDELLAFQPVRFPRWWLPAEAHGWAPYDSREHDWFILSADDWLMPA
ncbi:hypothetical protein [Mycobacterium cookii]|uniref:hypothetical protein n=1 Tax=Mycobacterium cookii TaxID=1775 RepID=UPI0013D3ACC7|nr:hypothetical protein [Mycobacterium cookii]